MVALCTLAEVKAVHPVIDYNDDDDILGELIEAASAAVINYLGDRADDVLDLDSNGELASGAEVPRAVGIATVFMARHLYEGEDVEKGGPGGASLQIRCSFVSTL